MDPGTITLDRESFKALASEVRVEILKQLEARRMTVTDLSHAMSLAKPTLLEHLDRLLSAGLVNKADEGRKWIYYDLTKRGRNILHPHQVKIMLSLAMSILLVAAGIAAVIAALAAPSSGSTGSGATTMPTTYGNPILGTQDGRSVGEAISEGAPGPWGLILVALAAVPLLVAFWYRRAGRDLIDSVRAQLAVP